jgi:UDP-glucose 4-epimerase
MNALIFGSSGCLGTALTDCLLTEGYKVTCAGRANQRADCDYIYCDLDNLDMVLKIDLTSYDTVFYAAQSRCYSAFPEDLVLTFTINSFAPTLLAKKASEIGISFNYISTGSVYAESDAPCRENAPFVSQESATMYVMSKMLGEQAMQSLGQNIKIFRPFFIFGHNARPETLIARIYKNILEGNEILLHGQDGLKINPISATDAARAVVLLSKTNEKIVNIAGPEAIDLRTIGNLIGNKLNKRAVFRELNQKHEKAILGNIQILEANNFEFKKRLYEFILET